MIQEKVISRDVVATDKLFCDECSEEIELVFPPSGELTEQGKNALHVIFEGGYGMLIDPIGEKSSFLLCKSCGIKAVASLKCAQHLLG